MKIGQLFPCRTEFRKNIHFLSNSLSLAPSSAWKKASEANSATLHGYIPHPLLPLEHFLILLDDSRPWVMAFSSGGILEDIQHPDQSCSPHPGPQWVQVFPFTLLLLASCQSCHCHDDTLLSWFHPAASPP